LFRKYNSVNMAWWHTGKHACLKIWEKFSRNLLAPWWHFMYPSHQFFKKPSSFPSVTCHLLLLHLTYPLIKESLDELLADTELAPRFQIHVQDLKFLFEYAIPTVICVLNPYMYYQTHPHTHPDRLSTTWLP
jgi:hypothetical protein